MILNALLIAILLQAAPAAKPPVAKASVAGSVVNAAGEPLAGIRVSLARTDVSLGPLTQMLAGDHPPVEMSLPAELLGLISEEIAAEIQNGVVNTAEAPQITAEAAAFKSLAQLNIQELIVTPTGSIAVVSKSLPPATTDDRGRFAFNAVEPGTYRLIFSGNGYAKQDYGQRAVGGAGVPMTLTPAQAKTDIVMRMMAVAAVSGNIRDVAGQPLAGIPVQLFHFTYDETGQRKEQAVAVTRTDDRGDYRMYYLTPGHYYARAGNPPGQNASVPVPIGLDALLLGGGYSSQNRIPQNYTQVYYPGSANPNSASTIEVPSGGDIRGIDFLLIPQQMYRVRGRVVDPRSGQPPQPVSVSLTVQNPDRSTGVIFSSFGGNVMSRPDGTFEIANVSAGAYTISASMPGPAPARQPDIASMSPAERNAYFEAQQAAENARPKAFASVNVVNGDVDGVLLAFGSGSPIAGRVRVESNAQNPALSFDFLRVLLRDSSANSESYSPNSPQPRSISADGTFRIDNVWPGEYRLSVGGLPPGFYLREARFGDVDLLNAPLRYIGPDSITLDVVISGNTGAIDGIAMDASGRPTPGAQVVLIPNNPNRTDLFKPATADSAGHFIIPGVAPGEYTLAAWETIEPFAYFDPNVIHQAEGQSKAVRVGELSNQTVNVTTIP